MRIIIALIALMALGALLPSMWAQDETTTLAAPKGLSDKTAPQAEEPENALLTTPSVASFLSNSWVPPSSTNASINTSLNNNTTSIIDTSAAPTYTAATANKDGVIAWTGESRFQFLQDDWTPNTPIEVIHTAPYTKHRMS